MTEFAKNEEPRPRSFPRPGTRYDGHIDDVDYQSRFLAGIGYTNKVIGPLRPLTAPLLRLSGFKVDILTTKERISGKMRKTSLEYDEIDGVMHGAAVNPKKCQWLKNMPAHPDEVWVQGGSHRFQAGIEVLDNEEAIEVVKFHTSRYPGHGRFWGWGPEQDDLETADSSPMLKVNCMFRIHERRFFSCAASRPRSRSRSRGLPLPHFMKGERNVRNTYDSRG